MQRLKIHMENCYGIKSLEKELDFTTSKVNAIYARNGLMKTSFTKVFKKIQDNKRVEIRDEIFRITPVVNDIQVDGDDIRKDDIFVIQSFENSYESDSIASLLINSELKQNLSEVINLKDRFLKLLEKKSGRKITKTVQGKKVYDLEPSIIEDFGFNERSFLLNLDYINLDDVDYDFSEIQYSAIYDDSVIKKIKSVEFQTKIVEFLDKSDEIYAEFGFLDKGRFTLPKLKDIEKGLKKNSFFVKENKILLDGDIEITNADELHIKIGEVECQLQDTNEFKEIEKLLSDAKGTILKDIIENCPEIVEELKIENLDEFKRKLWLSYIKSETEKFEELKVSYRELEETIDQAELDETPWKEALDLIRGSQYHLIWKLVI